MPAKPINPRVYFSTRQHDRQPSGIRVVMQNAGLLDEKPPADMLSLAGGMPNPATFPFTKIEAKLKDGSALTLVGKDLEKTLQYSLSFGFPRLSTQVNHIIQREHRPPREVLSIIGTGSQEMMARVLDLVLDTGDALLVENPTYAGCLSAVQPLRARFVAVDTDSEGMSAEGLHRVMRDWPQGMRRPRVVYLVPVGQNPGGSTMSERRKRDIYAAAQEHDLLIVEDDPYWWLHFGPIGAKGAREPPPSFLALDTDGRVLRLDSFSKVLSSGMRLGFATGHPDFIRQLELDVQSTRIAGCGVSQALAACLLERLGDAGWAEHVAGIKDFYQRRRDLFAAACERHLKGLADWEVPTAGMFFWIGLRDVECSRELIEHHAKAANVLLVPGGVFVPGEGRSNAVRASFSIVAEKDIDVAVSRLAGLLRSRRGGAKL
eukprot:TRINITY_DN60917_c0_g1_i1.p1 TRINITY_DN60917_c0_g1~~TRINITY_DN60917_c0_g1_i1.p1  ORF type:complete len:432 (+),score=129.91 TRINITY_DN60917_c0_g1_i1:102-1397(+)